VSEELLAHSLHDVQFKDFGAGRSLQRIYIK
jgi:hypothetical protein